MDLAVLEIERTKVEGGDVIVVLGVDCSARARTYRVHARVDLDDERVRSVHVLSWRDGDLVDHVLEPDDVADIEDVAAFVRGSDEVVDRALEDGRYWLSWTHAEARSGL